jgi:hypothetical protein
MVQFNEFYGLFGPLNAVIEKVREAAGNVINCEGLTLKPCLMVAEFTTRPQPKGTNQ